ncbi:MAG: hypothetical protein KDK40_00250 [Chlamydiia bacterium]|nr:hypothetical protein [Chlamydiia bacterium]
MKPKPIQFSHPLRPFSHHLGTTLLLPRSPLVVRCFPTRLEFLSVDHLDKDTPLGSLEWRNSGPIEGFTVRFDMDRERVELWGHSEKGLFHYIFWWSGDHLQLKTRRLPSEIEGPFIEGSIACKVISGGEERAVHSSNNLYLGVSKKQEWESIARRNSLREFLPFLYRQGEWYPEIPPPTGGVGEIFSQWKQKIDESDASTCEKLIGSLFSTGYRDFCTPTLVDSFHRGYGLSQPTEDDRALAICSTFSELLRRHFVRCDDRKIHLLPLLLPSLRCGRLIGIELGEGNRLDLEWSKKEVRRCVLRIATPRPFQFVEAKGMQSFRLRRESEQMGKRFLVGDVLPIDTSGNYLLDQFTKKSSS